jgi:hypothetical protein
VLASSNGGALVDFAAGTKDVFVTYPSEKAVTEDYGNALAATTAANLAGGAAGSIPYQTAANTTAMLATGTGVLIGGTTPSYTMSPSLTQVTVAGDPTVNLQVATKQYVDTQTSAGIHFHEPVRVESPTNLNATYNNGTSGVGATLTNAGTQAALVLDGVTVIVADRVLIYTQTNQTQNGIYVVTTVGSGSTNWVLTRSSDADTYVNASPDGLSQGSTVFVQQGTTGAGETYTCNTVGTIVFGTTAITFAQISSAQIYSAGTGLTLTGTTFSLTSPVATTLGGTGLTSFTSGGAVYATSSSTLTTGTLPATAGGTGQSSYTTGDLVYAASATTLGVIADVATGNALISGGAGADPSYGKIGLTTHITGTLAVGNGGTGATTLTGYLVGNGTAAFSTTATIPTSDLSGTISLTTQISGTLGAGNGGTGISSYTVGDILYASATTTLSSLADVATGNALISGGVSNAPLWGKIGLTTHVSGTLAVGNGGSGATTLTGYLKGNGTSAFTASATIPAGDITSAALTKADDTNVTLTLGGSPTTALLAATSITAGWTGQLAVSRGGTGNSTLTSGYLLKGNGVSPTSASVVYDTGTNVGMGTASPGSKLDVRGVITGGDGTIQTVISYLAAAGVTGTLSNHPYVFYANNAERVRIATNGNLLVGTTTDFGGRLTLIPAVTPTTFAGGNQLQIGEATNNTAYRLQMGYINDPVQGYVGSLQAYAGSVPTNLCLQGDGGNVIVGGATSVYGTSGRGLIETNGATSAINALKVGGTAIAYFGVNSSTAEIVTPGAIPLNFLTSNTQRLSINSSGNVTANVDFRAPIFYDSANTAYYLDPASGSNLNGTLVNNGGTAMTAGWNRNMMLASTFPVLVFNSANTKYAGIGVDYTTAAAALRFWVNASSSDVVTGTNAMNINTGGYVEAGGSFRAPIFYDLDNTAYYVDPAGTSALSTVTYGSSPAGGGGGGRTVPSPGSPYSLRQDFGSDNTGWRYGIAKNVSGTVTVQFFVSDSGIAEAVGDMRAPIFYDSNNTGYYLDPASTSVTSQINVGTGLNVFDGAAVAPDPYGIVGITRKTDNNYSYLGFTRAGQHAMGMGIDTGNTFWIGGCSSGFNGVRTSSWLLMHTSGYVTAPVDMRAPIFYDSNNTAWYVDPAGASYLSSIYTDTVNSAAVGDPLELCYARGNEVRIGPSGGNLPIIAGEYTRPAAGTGYLSGRYGSVEGNGTTGPIYCISTSYGPTSTTLGSMYGIGFTDGASSGVWAGGGWGMYVAAAGVARIFLDGGNGIGSASASLRAPIFYDSNNTGYYLDPAGTTNLNVLQLAGSITTINNFSPANSAIRLTPNLHLNATAGNAVILNWDNGTTSGLTFRIGDGAGTDVFTTYANGAVYASIIYDISNSAYYVDPASTSNIYQLTGAITHGSYGSFSASGSLNGYAGIAFPAVSATLMMNQGASGFYFNNNTWGMYCSNVGSVLAAIYYDISNTAYYGDFASTGTSINVAGSIVAAGNVTAYSDIRVKDNVETIPSALDKLDQIRGVTYTRTDLEDKERRYAGVIAQEIEAVLPEAVRDLGNIKAVDYNATIALLIQAVKELTDKVKALEAKEQ